MGAIRIVGLGGSLRAPSSSRAALGVALASAREHGAEAEAVEVADLELPMYLPGAEAGTGAARLADAVAGADAMVWSSPLYHGSISGSFKNAIDWLQLLADREPPYLTGKPVGLIATAGGTQGLQAVNTMEFVVRSLRGWAVPLVIPIARASQAFDLDGNVTDAAVEAQLRALGAEVMRAALQFRETGACDYSQHRSAADSKSRPLGD